ncbi:hypothetical protein KKF61_08405 [Patescibacteria group bacterium]|nr:hypothetical protein [Patescibacteria group bacterium]
MTNNTTLMTLGESDAVLGMAILFCMMLLVLGVKEKMFWLLAGPCWIIMGIAIFIDYGEAFMLMSVGLGLTLLFMGAYDAFKR